MIEESYSAGQKIGRYSVVRVLGSGGFGTVYLAEDADLGRLVAIKVPSRGQFASPKEMERFFVEARTVAKLKHPAVVGIYDVAFSDEQVPYVVMEYVQGQSLAELLRKERLPFARAAELACQIAEAVHYAHTARFRSPRPQAGRTCCWTPRAARTSPTSAWPSTSAPAAERGRAVGDAPLHGARTSPRRNPPPRRPGRCLGAGRHALRDAHRPAAVRRRHRPKRSADEILNRDPEAAPADRRRHSRRALPHLPESAAETGDRALRHGLGLAPPTFEAASARGGASPGGPLAAGPCRRLTPARCVALGAGRLSACRGRHLDLSTWEQLGRLPPLSGTIDVLVLTPGHGGGRLLSINEPQRPALEAGRSESGCKSS